MNQTKDLGLGFGIIERSKYSKERPDSLIEEIDPSGARMKDGALAWPIPPIVAVFL